MKPPEQQPSPDSPPSCDEEVAQRMQEAENDPSVWLSFEELVSELRRSS